MLYAPSVVCTGGRAISTSETPSFASLTRARFALFSIGLRVGASAAVTDRPIHSKLEWTVVRGRSVLIGPACLRQAPGAADIARRMTSQPTFAEQELMVATRRRARTRMRGRDLLAELLVGLGLVGGDGRGPVLAPAAAHVHVGRCALVAWLAMVLATRVQFDTPFGFTVATQLAFVPLLFALPVALVPLAVALALAMALVPDVIAGRSDVQRLLRSRGECLVRGGAGAGVRGRRRVAGARRSAAAGGRAGGPVRR